MQAPRCPWCGAAPLVGVDVHGHVQCARCGTNVDPCCGGETCQAPAPEDLDAVRALHRESGCGCE